MRVIHICVGLLLVVLGIAAPLALGAVTPGYDARSDFLSELGQTGASRAALMNYGVFLPVGVLWAVASLLLLRTMPKGSLGLTGVVLLFGNAASYIGAAFFPCDAGCPASGSFSQAMHNFSGALGYFLTPLALALIGAHLMSKGRPAFGGATLLVAAIIGAAFAQMLADTGGAQAGAWQRAADFPAFVWMAVALAIARRDCNRSERL